MDERQLEELMKHDIETIFTDILKKHHFILPISTKSRSGAEISDYLEDDFVEYLSQNTHDRIYNPQSSPKGATKNPLRLLCPMSIFKGYQPFRKNKSQTTISS